MTHPTPTAPLDGEVNAAWLELSERDDRTSPEEYPDMCLIEQGELAEFMGRAYRLAASGTRGMRPETTSEHIARDMREGTFPARSEPRMVPAGTCARCKGRGCIEHEGGDSTTSVVEYEDCPDCTPAGTMGPSDGEVSLADQIRDRAAGYRRVYESCGLKLDCSTTNGALEYGRAQGMEMAADYLDNLAALRPAQPTPLPDAGDGLEPQWLIMKRGLYYCPNAMGYTGIRDKAGRYSEAEARGHADEASGVTAIREDEAPLFAPNCFDDIARDYLQERLTEAARRIAELEGENERVERSRSRYAKAFAEQVRDHIATKARLAKAVAGLEPFAALARVRYPEEGGAPSWIDLMTNNGECDELSLHSHVALGRDRAQVLDAADFRRAEEILADLKAGEGECDDQ